MAKVFTITEGLQNMGALKTGGQGSVYKGMRVGEIITAVKLIPTPVFAESKEDKNFRDFQNEVEKLKAVNLEPNPNVVKILSSGLSETGNFPFIEMEYIEGPDLEELLKPPHEPVFTIKEVVKVAEHLSNALAHCHQHNVKHGDLKSNNVKFNIKTGNYVLLDFGLAAMSDEQRRTSLRQAGAVEFMAPEQNEGLMLFETDIYSFGIVLFELLAGRVPFPLKDKGETARNAIRLAHMEAAVPDLLSLRQEMLPVSWQDHKKERELSVPTWLVQMVSKCLEKEPDKRFRNGIELHDFVISNITHIGASGKITQARNLPVQERNNAGLENEQLERQVLQIKKQVNAKERELLKWTALIEEKEQEIQFFGQKAKPLAVASTNNNIPKSSFITVLLLTIVVSVFSAYYFIKSNNRTSKQISNSVKKSTTPSSSNKAAEKPVAKKISVSPEKDKKSVSKKEVEPNTPKQSVKERQSQQEVEDEVSDSYVNPGDPPTPKAATGASGKKYTVVSKAFFHNAPDESTQRKAFIVHWNNAVLTPLDEENNFIYVVYVNDKGQTSKGWLRKKDLKVAD